MGVCMVCTRPRPSFEKFGETKPRGRGDRVAQVGVFCVCAVGFVEICENEATQEE